MDIRGFLQKVLPYGYIINRYDRVGMIEKYMSESKEDELPDLMKSIESKFDKIVSVQGFGYSGSGAVVDLLREFSNCNVVGYVSVEGSKTARNKSMAEIDFIRLSGGLFEIEKYVESNNLFHEDALIKRTFCLFSSSYLFRLPELRPYFISFLKAIIKFSFPKLSQSYYNGYLYLPRTPASIYFLEKMSRADYRKLCSNFLNSVFNYFHSENINYFVADQLFSDFEFDTDRNKQYLPNIKTIFVPRDPRDLYAWTNYKKVEWIPQDLESFIQWYKIIYSPLNASIDDSLIVNYEAICLDYDNECKKILEYLDLDENFHLNKKRCFNPDVSKKFVGIWKDSIMPMSDFELIEKGLGNFCCSLID